MTIPTATYRLQFRNGMTFRRAMTLVPYLKRLGISHLYASPVFAAAAGSTHGYDITDANRFDPALGTAEDFDALAATLTENGLGLILDIVPNHMAASLDNPWWRSVIERGQASPHAHAFDIDWNRRLTLPWLAKPFAEAVADGDIVLSADAEAGCLALSLPGLAVPLDPESYDAALEGDDGVNGRLLSLADIARREGEDRFHMRLRALLADEADRARLEARLAALSQDAAHLEDVHERQHFELIHWREAPKRLSYRRFFEVTELVGVNVEDDRVFEDSHRLILELVRDGKVQGLRVDHIDGLADPAAYLTRLRRDIGDETYLIVEKILEDGEDLPADWPVSGTTGYEFIDRMTHLLVERKGAERLRRQYAALGGLTDVAAGLHGARQSMIARNFAGEVSGLKRLAIQLALSEETHVGVGEEAIAAALNGLSQMVVDFPCIAAVDINPLLADADGIVALDARIEIDPEAVEQAGPNPALVIRPYPAEWERDLAVGAAQYRIRPIKPADIGLYPDFLAKIAPEDIRLRFLAPRKKFPDEMLKRLTQLDYDRDMAFVVLEAGGALAGVARLSCDPDRSRGEYALLVRTDLQGQGLGWALLQQVVDYAKAEGIGRIEGMVLSENEAMLRMCREFGFAITHQTDQPGLALVALDLG